MQNKTTVWNTAITTRAAHLQRYNIQLKRQTRGNVHYFKSTGQKAQQSLFYNIFKKNNHVLHGLRHRLKTTENEMHADWQHLSLWSLCYRF